MGFSVEYSGLILAHLLYNAALVLSLFKWAFYWAVGSIGYPFWSSDHDSASSTASQQSALTAQMIRDRLGVTTYGEVISHSLPGSCDDDTCAVCLNQLKSRDQVRELRNCCHVFHIKCIDRWLDHGDQKNCPLCRAPLLVTRCGSDLGCDMTRSEPSWAVERLLYLFGDDLL